MNVSRKWQVQNKGTILMVGIYTPYQNQIPTWVTMSDTWNVFIHVHTDSRWNFREFIEVLLFFISTEECMYVYDKIL